MKNNFQRAKTAVILIQIILFLEIAMLISGYLQYDLLLKMEAGVDISNEAADQNDQREMIIAAIYTLVYFVSVVTFIQWFRRAYANLHTVSNNLLYDEGWAAGGWFVPILNLFRPYQIMKDLYIKTNSYLSAKLEGYKKVSNEGLIMSWWILWIIGNILGNSILRLSMRAKDMDDYLMLTNLSMISAGLGIPLALFIIYQPKTNFDLGDDILDQDVF